MASTGLVMGVWVGTATAVSFLISLFIDHLRTGRFDPVTITLDAAKRPKETCEHKYYHFQSQPNDFDSSKLGKFGNIVKFSLKLHGCEISRG